MKPNEEWIEDWRIGVDPAREREVATELVSLFAEFWNVQTLDDKSKTTRYRYSGGLHALGGYLVEQAISDDGLGMTADQLVSEHVGDDGGPLIAHDDEAWQDEIDMVCRKLCRHMTRNR